MSEAKSGEIGAAVDGEHVGCARGEVVALCDAALAALVLLANALERKGAASREQWFAANRAWHTVVKIRAAESEER